MIDNEDMGHYINDDGEEEYFPVIIVGGKAYNLTALKALLLAVRNLRFSERVYENEYYNKLYRRKSLRIKIGFGSKRKYNKYK